MAISISKRKTNIDIERKILLNLITNKEYSKQIIPTLEHDTFATAYCKKIASWVVEFYQQYNEPPQKTIQAIFNVKKQKNMAVEDVEIIEDFLDSLSDQYIAEGEDNKVNTPYLVQTSIEYIRQRHYENLGESLLAYSKLGQVNECENLLLKDKNISGAKAEYVNLHDPETIKLMVANKDKGSIFQIDGVLGELIGPVQRGMLIGVMGKTGSGKSWVLRELLFQAIINKVNCFEFNFEMGIESIAFRHYKRILGMGDEPGEYLLPVFDCASNANGTCRRKERKSKVSLINSVGDTPIFGEQNPLYVPCEVCRKAKNSKDYKFSTWHESTYKKAINQKAIEKGARGLKLLYGDRLRSICFPSGMATVADCFHQIDMAEYLEDFTTDFASFDYDEIMASASNFTNPLDAIDEIYKTLRGELQKRKMAGVIGMQVNRTGAQKAKISTFDNSGSFKKIMHTDLVLCIDISDEEKEAGIMNISVGKMREGKFQASRSVKVLINLSLGQSYLDATWGDIEYHDN